MESKTQLDNVLNSVIEDITWHFVEDVVWKSEYVIEVSPSRCYRRLSLTMFPLVVFWGSGCSSHWEWSRRARWCCLFVATICNNRPHSTDDSYMCAFGRLQTMMRSVSIGGRKGQVLCERLNMGGVLAATRRLAIILTFAFTFVFTFVRVFVFVFVSVFVFIFVK